MNLSWILDSSPVALAVLGLLLLFSILSWSIIVLKFFIFKKASRSSAQFSDLFWRVRRLDEIYEESRRFSSSPLAQVFRQGYQELVHLRKEQASDDFSLEHALRKASSGEMMALESMIPFLATVGSTAPFIGLFGTVVGIMASFQEIGAKGSASLATVAPGIAEALVATAAGLVAAIPAVMAYNYFSNRIRNMALELETFSSDFLNIVRKNH